MKTIQHITPFLTNCQYDAAHRIGNNHLDSITNYLYDAKYYNDVIICKVHYDYTIDYLYDVTYEFNITKQFSYSNDVVAYDAEVIAVSGCYPFGMIMPGRSYSSNSYRYGFNGQEKDDEIKGSGNYIDFSFRGYDPRISRFFAVDPLAPNYPMLTPYQFASNTPIWAQELEGLEANYTNEGSTQAEGAGPTNSVSGPLSDNYADDLGYTSYGFGESESVATDNSIGDKVAENYNNSNGPEGSFDANSSKQPNPSPSNPNYPRCVGCLEQRVGKAIGDLGGTLPTDSEFRNVFFNDGTTKAHLEGAPRALSKAGFGEFKTKEQILNGELKIGAAIQVWSEKDIQTSVNTAGGYGHSAIFLGYIKTDSGEIIGLKIGDQGSGYDTSTRGYPVENASVIVGANLGGTIQKQVTYPR